MSTWASLPNSTRTMSLVVYAVESSGIASSPASLEPLVLPWDYHDGRNVFSDYTLRHCSKDSFADTGAGGTNHEDECSLTRRATSTIAPAGSLQEELGPAQARREASGRMRNGYWPKTFLRVSAASAVAAASYSIVRPPGVSK